MEAKGTAAAAAGVVVKQTAMGFMAPTARTGEGDDVAPPRDTPILQFSSAGNDSVALTWWLALRGFTRVKVLFTDTGWAAPGWLDRVQRMARWVEGLGFEFVGLPPVSFGEHGEGLPGLVRAKKGWPRNGLQFCTGELKIKPAHDWLEANDPERRLVCAVGVRRGESQARADYPAMLHESGAHGGRPRFAPLVDYSASDRDWLLTNAGWEPLDHNSDECFPCINSNRSDLRRVADVPERVRQIEALEAEMGMTSKGKPRVMFRPYRHQGATGVREVLRWAASGPGQYAPPPGSQVKPDATDEALDQLDLCADGWCGL